MLVLRAVSCSSGSASVPWAGRLHLTPWDSRTLDKALRTVWLPQTLVQVRTDPRSRWYWPLGHRPWCGDSLQCCVSPPHSSLPLSSLSYTLSPPRQPLSPTPPPQGPSYQLPILP